MCIHMCVFLALYIILYMLYSSYMLNKCIYIYIYYSYIRFDVDVYLLLLLLSVDSGHDIAGDNCGPSQQLNAITTASR